MLIKICLKIVFANKLNSSYLIPNLYDVLLYMSQPSSLNSVHRQIKSRFEQIKSGHISFST